MQDLIPKELVQKVRRLEINTRKIVQSTFSGSYHSAFKGQGIDFSDLREYQVGDDVRQINWSVSARSFDTHVNLYEEERELTVLLVVDISGSTGFGSQGKSKREIAAEISAILGFSAIHNQDKVGLLLFSEDVEVYVPPKTGKDHMLRLLRDVFYFNAKSKKTSISSALDFVSNILKKKAVVFVISDFIDQHYQSSLKLLAKKHDVIPVVMEDKRESELPKVGIIALEDQESGETLYLNSSLASVQEAFSNIKYAERLEQDRIFTVIGCDSVRINTQEDYTKPLAKFFKNRFRGTQ